MQSQVVLMCYYEILSRHKIGGGLNQESLCLETRRLDVNVGYWRQQMSVIILCDDPSLLMSHPTFFLPRHKV